MRNARSRRFQPDFGHRLAEFHPVLGLINRLCRRADHLDVKLRQRAIGLQRQRGVQRGLPAHGRQHSHLLIRIFAAFFFDDFSDNFGSDRFNISRAIFADHIGVGHDRRGVGIDEDDAIALLAQRLTRLRPRIIKLARLPDNDGACADDQDGLDVSSFGHVSTRNSPSPPLGGEGKATRSGARERGA